MIFAFLVEREKRMNKWSIKTILSIKKNVKLLCILVYFNIKKLEYILSVISDFCLDNESAFTMR